MKSEYFKIALKNLTNRKLRSWLTMLGIFISIATIFTLVSLSLGLQGAIKEQFDILGADKFFIMPKAMMAGGPGSGGESFMLTEKDVDAVENMNGIKDLTYYTIGNIKAEFRGETKYLMAVGIPPNRMDIFVETGSWKVMEGRFPKMEDKAVVFLGSDFKKENIIFKKALNLGDKIEINGNSFKVIGFAEPIGNPSDDSNVLIPLEEFRIIANISERVDMIMLQVQDGENVTEVSQNVEKDLRKERGLTEKTQDFTVSTPEELLKSIQTILGIITAFLAGIAGISLLVGAIGIANTMYTSILERTREIGVMKAIGAKNSDIAWIFLIESGLLGLVGGIIGVILGYGLSKTIEYIAINQLNTTLLQVATPFYLIFGCLFFGFAVGAISGVLPAIQASKTNVVDALRYE
jgi:putative ABC transport system permease protein